MSHNIQQLFSIIRAFQVREYLVAKGWRVLTEDGDEIMRFEGPVHEGGQPYQVALWSSDKERRFRNRVPNVIFMLSQVEQRQPVEIALDISSLKRPEVKPATTAESQDSGPVDNRVRIRNGRAKSVDLVLPQQQQRFRLAHNESAQLVTDGQRSPPQITYHDESIEIVCREGAVRLLYASDEQATPSAAVITGEELERANQQNGIAVPELMDALKTTLSRADFELSAEGAEVSPAACQRQAAVIAVGLAKQLPEHAATAHGLWRICARLVERSNVHLELADSQHLFQVAQEDDADAPMEVLKWLQQRCHA